jgi:glutathione S-transferase
MYKLYSMQRSGNSYKVRLALALLNAPYKAIEVDILRGESRTPEFLARNPSGQVPLLEVADGRYLAESNAILWYVAIGTSLAPEDRIDRAQALQWMFFEQHALEPSVGAAYFWLVLVRGGRDLQTHSLEDWMERGYAALRVMENHLKTHDYFAAGHLTVADIAMYGYTHVANQRLRPHGLSVGEGLAEAGRKRAEIRLDGVEASRGNGPGNGAGHRNRPHRRGLNAQPGRDSGHNLLIFMSLPRFRHVWRVPPQC